MSTLIVAAFDDKEKADQTLTKLNLLQKEYLIDLQDAVVVIRDNKGKIHLKQSYNLPLLQASSGLATGSIFGFLVGLIFLNPLAGFLAGAGVGAATGALFGAMSDYGIDDNFIKSLSKEIPNESSAIFILVRKAQPEKVIEEFKDVNARILKTSLSPDQEKKLQEALTVIK